MSEHERVCVCEECARTAVVGGALLGNMPAVVSEHGDRVAFEHPHVPQCRCEVESKGWVGQRSDIEHCTTTSNNRTERR